MKQMHNILSLSGKSWVIHPAGQQPIYFDYNLAGDNIKVYSSVADDWERNYTYDMLGRRLTYTEGELAESYTYDGSNPATHSQSWFENGMPQSKTTTYHYNAHRLDSVSYADALTTIYHYDQYGRVDSLYDESGVMCYEYGNMGEVTRETRIYALPFLTSALALSTQFGYDSWGRVDSIVYPDNETVKYRYGCGGQLQGIYNRQVPAYTYLDSVLYDRFGAKVSQKYGNGLKTTYSYNSLTRRLSNIATMDGGSQVSSFAYTYDNVGNVTQVTSSCPWLNSQTFSETFTYDASDQLTAAEETQSRSYRLDVTYGDWGRITDYALVRTDMTDNSTVSEACSFSYPATASDVQCSQTMFAPESQAGTSDAQFTFGINGSLRKREVTSPDNYTEYYLFNSQANLKAYSDDGLDFAYYGYNASNTRTYKLTMTNANQWVNGQPGPLRLQPQQAMLYPNAYVNFNQNGEYTKHYYSGTERICSRLGDAYVPMTASADSRTWVRRLRADALFRGQVGELVSGDEPSLPSDRGGGGTREPVSPDVEYSPVTTLTALMPTGNPDDIFYYHTNHLGSTAYVTDQNQNVTQGFLYAPFGEITTEFDANFGNDIIPKYAFNAKELDEETGMYYYEARYYKPPVFTSRDAMFEKKPWLTPYHYCSNNPVGRVDFNGMDDYEVNRKTGEIKLLKTTDDNYDRLVAQNEKGIVKYKKNGDYKKRFVLKVDKEFMESQQTGKQVFGVEAKIYRLKGENREREATNIFRFLSFHTEVEWGLAGSKDENTICKGSDKYEWEGYRAALRYGENLEYYYHSHPGNDASPFPSKEEGRDLDCWNTLWEKNPNALMGILMWHSTIQLYRKTNNNKGYAPTNKN